MDAGAIVTLCVFLGGLVIAGFVRTWILIGKLTARIVQLETVIQVVFGAEGKGGERCR